MVLVGELQCKDDEFDIERAWPHWPTLAGCNADVTIVARADVSLANSLPEGGTRDAAAFLGEYLRKTIEQARGAGARVVGVQLDYDCPTSRLNDYGVWLDALRVRMDDTPLSITVLPDWLGSSAFPDLVQNTDYYVLQVHSLEVPKSADAPIRLCRADRIEAYVEGAARIGVPFYVALPTYGYKLAFGPDGKVIGLCAEGPDPAWSPGCRTRVVMADPFEMASVVNELSDRHPPELIGVAWFRLPVETDRLNWDMPTLEAVMTGRPPAVSFKAEVRNPSPGLYEVWVANDGPTSFRSVPIEVRVSWGRGTVRAYDMINGFRGNPSEEKPSLRLNGVAPSTNKPVMAAWFRVAEPAENGPCPLKAGPVEVLW